MKDVTECGLPIRRRSGVTECILPAGHKAPWCQDQRALDAAETLARVSDVAMEMRAVLGLFGLAKGRVDTERWIFNQLWSGRSTLPDSVLT